MQQQQSMDSYNEAAKRLWKRLYSTKPAQFHDPLFESLTTDEAILLLHAAVLPNAKSYRQANQQKPWFLFLFFNPLIQLLTRIQKDSLFLILIFFVVLAVVVVVAVLVTRNRHVKTNVNALLLRLLPNCHSTITLPALLDFAVWTDQPHETHTSLAKTIAQLLLRAGDQELLMILTEERRTLLRSWCQRHNMSSEIVTAALLALSSAKDPQTTSLAQKLLSNRIECHNVARAILDTV